MKKIILGIYTLFLLFITVFSYAYVDTNLFYLHKVITGLYLSARPLLTVIFIAMLFIFFIFYGVFLYWTHQGILKKKELIYLILASVFCLIFSYPAMLSYDIFNYIATAKVLFHYHENPYVIMPIDIKNEPMLAFMQAANKTALYGFFWIIITGIPFFAGLGNFLVTLFGFKIFVALFYFATTFFIWKMTKNLMSVVFFALNPLVIIETLVSGHNDMVMMFFALLSICLLSKRRWILGILAFLASFFVKYATIFLIPAVYLMAKNSNVSLKRIMKFAWWGMMIIFLFSTFREEIYPWYAIWFLLPASFLVEDMLISQVSLAFSFGLLFRYVPYMLWGTYFGITPIVKTIVTFIPPIIILVLFGLHKIIPTKNYEKASAK